MLANAFEALKQFDWGTDLAALDPIESAVTAAHGDARATAELEEQLIATLNESLSRDARSYVCRKLAIVGTAASVPALAALLPSADDSHMARYALERINTPEAANALREALTHVSGNLKVGVVSSLGARRDSAAVEPLATVMKDTDPSVARAATLALGAIGTTEAVAALRAALQAGAKNKSDVIDSLLACAESQLRENNKVDAVAIYTSLADGQHGRYVTLAATRGILACGAVQS